ncbi:MAG: hypothetical protein ACYCWE_19360 [Eubacteriales bacterium]
MIKQPNCIGYEPKKPCGILSVKKCLDRECIFFKSAEQALSSYNKAMKRLASLDWMKQLYISHKYYAGKMPWINGGLR